MNKVVEVVAAALLRNEGQAEVLIAQRPDGKHMAGFWEFPGGKVEPEETHLAALQRELAEELAVENITATPLMTLQHSYPEKTVRLHLFTVNDWQGEAHGAEGQNTAWIHLSELHQQPLLPADKPFVTALQLPSLMAITPDFFSYQQACEKIVQNGLSNRGLMLRGDWLKSLSADDISKLIITANQKECLLGLNIGYVTNDIRSYLDSGLKWLHIPAWYDANLTKQLLNRYRDKLLISTSCHSEAELQQAHGLGISFAFLSPVLESKSAEVAIGFAKAKALAVNYPLPLYALGGVKPENLTQANDNGLIGVAGISAF